MNQETKHPFYDRVKEDLANVSTRLSDHLMEIFPALLNIPKTCENGGKFIMEFDPEKGLNVEASNIAMRSSLPIQPTQVDMMAALGIYLFSCVDDALEEVQILSVCEAIDKTGNALGLSPDKPIEPKILVMLLNEAGADVNDAMRKGETLQ